MRCQQARGIEKVHFSVGDLCKTRIESAFFKVNSTVEKIAVA
jgi:hypothetical protein